LAGSKKSDVERCLAALRNATRSMTLKQLSRTLSWPRQEKDRLQDLLDTLVEKGDVTLIDQRHYALASEGKMIQGTLVCTRRGTAYLSTDAYTEDLYVPRMKLGAGMHRDRVLAKVGRYRNKLEAEIVEVIERGTFSFVGVVHRIGKGFWLEPRDERLPDRVRVTEGEADHGEVIAAQFVTWPRSLDDTPTARVVKRLAREGEAADQTELLIYDLGLPTMFPATVTAQADETELDVDALLKGHHEDLRETPFITVDPQSARDFDDAVCARCVETGGWILTVAVADVSLLVKSGSAMDDEAFMRGTSVYLPDRVIPMLPDRLSGDLCSLRPDVERPAMVVEMRVNELGEISHPILKEAVIKSHKRLSYDAATDFFEEPDESVLPKLIQDQLVALRDVTRALRRRRQASGYLDLEIAEAKIQLDEAGTVDSIRAYERQESHLMIEESMLAANVVVANFCIEHERDTLFRVHGEPDQDKLKAFRDGLSQITGIETVSSDVSEFSARLREIEDPDLRDLLSTLLLRAMMKAEYKTQLGGHYGLGFDAYLHFTSPIRRYPDLVVHRIVRGLLRKKGKSKSRSLSEIAGQSNRRERLALEAERDVQALYKCLWLKPRIGEHFSGFVTHVSAKGAFVKLGDSHCDGFIPFADAGRRRGPRRPQIVIGSREALALPLHVGERIEVALINVSVNRRRVELRQLSEEELAER
jgi:ribonuclease R